MTDDVPVVIAGARGSAVRTLIGALVARVSPLPRTPPDTFLTLRHGSRRRVLAYVPGYRQPRPYPAVPATPAREPARPPRRVDATLPEALLAYVSIVAAPELNEEGAAHRQVVLDLLDRGAGLILVTDGRTPYRQAELDLLRSAAARTDGLFLAVVHPDEGEGWANVVLANQNSLARLVPELAIAPWYPVAKRRPDLADLRRALVEWAGERRARYAPALGPRAMRIAPEAHASGWEELITDQIATHRRELDVRLAAALADLHDTCIGGLNPTRPLRDPTGAPTARPPASATRLPASATRLPARLDRELLAFSVRVTAELRAAADGVLRAALARVVTEAPDPRTLGRVRAALRRRIVEGSQPEWDHALLVTRTAAVAVLSGEGSFAGVAPHVGEHEQPVLAPVGIALTAGCYGLWPEATAAQRRASQRDSPEPLVWLERAVAAVQRELTGELSRQFDDLQRGLTELIADGIDHGLMLV